MNGPNDRTATPAHPSRGCGGQAMTEYIIMVVMFFGIALAMVLLMAVFTESGWRMISLVSMDL